MTVTAATTSTYENKPPPEAPKNKANSKPIGQNAKMSLTAYANRNYERKPRSSRQPGIVQKTTNHCRYKPVAAIVLFFVP